MSQVKAFAEAGHLLVYQMNDIERDNPSWIDDDVRKAVYATDIGLRIIQGIGGIEKGLRLLNPGFMGCVDALEEAEMHIVEARRRGYGDYFPQFKEAVDKLMPQLKDHFNASLFLQRYMQTSALEWGSVFGEIGNGLPLAAEIYANNLLAKSKRAAKSLKKTCRSDRNFTGGLLRGLKQIEGLKEYGVDKTQQIAQIRDLAYKCGVEFVVERASVFDEEKKKVLLERARLNASRMDRTMRTC